VSAHQYQGAMARLREEWGGRCVMAVECYGTREQERLEFAHLPGKPTGVEGRGRGRADRYHDVRKHPDSYVLICRDCHVVLDKRGGGARPWPEQGPRSVEIGGPGPEDQER